jgi:hypothetical protein
MSMVLKSGGTSLLKTFISSATPFNPFPVHVDHLLHLFGVALFNRSCPNGLPVPTIIGKTYKESLF